jgi:hypothetical protein
MEYATVKYVVHRMFFPCHLTNMGKGQNYEFHNVKNQKEHRKSWRRSQHRKAL